MWKNDSPTALCYGCQLPLGSSMICGGGAGLIHNNMACAARAEARLEAPREVRESGPATVGDPAEGPLDPSPVRVAEVRRTAAGPVAPSAPGHSNWTELVHVYTLPPVCKDTGQPCRLTWAYCSVCHAVLRWCDDCGAMAGEWCTACLALKPEGQPLLVGGPGGGPYAAVGSAATAASGSLASESGGEEQSEVEEESAEWPLVATPAGRAALGAEGPTPGPSRLLVGGSGGWPTAGARVLPDAEARAEAEAALPHESPDPPSLASEVELVTGRVSPRPSRVRAREPDSGGRRGRSRVSATGRPLVRNVAESALCYGCGKRLGLTLVCSGGAGLIHDSLVCDSLAETRLARAAAADDESRGYEAAERAARGEEALREEVAREAAAPPVVECPPCDPAGGMRGQASGRAAAAPSLVAAPTRSGSDQKRAQLTAMLGDRRLQRVRCCLDGKCDEKEEEVMHCTGRGCSVTLHGVACAQMTAGFAALGRFECAECILCRLCPDADPKSLGEEAWRHALGTLVLTLCEGAEQTGAGLGAFKALEQKFVLSLGDLGTRVTLPSDDATVFKMFLKWLVKDAERAKSLDTVWRAAGSAMARTREVNLTRNADVKAFYEALRQRHGEEAHPRTAVTRRMVKLIDRQLLAKRSPPHTLPRNRLLYHLEIMMGLRVGEAVNAGDFHGLMANNLVILTNQTTGVVSVEAMLEHSKTKFQRYINAVGVSEGECQLDLAGAIRAYWKIAGFDLRGERGEGVQHNGYLVEGPNYSVLRVSLLGLDETTFARLVRVLESSDVRQARKWAEFVKLRGQQRLDSKTSQDKKYINVVGGVAGCSDIGTVKFEMELAGLSAECEELPGPLMRATHGPTMGHTHMPLQAASTYDSLHDMLDEAYELANAESPDPELDLRGLEAPLWGHHSFRRFADTVARETMEETDTSEGNIDIIFGWNEKMASKKMQLHYKSQFDREKRAKVTKMI